MDRASVQLLTEASYYRNLSSKRNPEEPNTIRKIRVICYDPDATDSSSSDEHDEDPSWLKRRIVQEITLPNSSFSITSSRSVTEVSCKGSDNGERATRVSSAKENRGARRRKRRVEIRRPVDGNAEEEAARAYEVKKIEIDAFVEADKSQGSSCSENLEIQMLDTCVEGLNELDSLFINDYGEVFDDLTAFSDLPICESDVLDGFLHLPSFDFELGKEEFAWIEEPLNIACCP